MTRKILIAVVLVLLIGGALVGVKASQVKKLTEMARSFAPPPTSILAPCASVQPPKSDLGYNEHS